MQVNELRVGNWISIENAGFYEWGWKDYGNYIKSKGDGYNLEHLGVSEIISDKIQPIPLTPEILEKAGFKQYGSGIKREIWKYGFPVIRETRLDLYKKTFSNGETTGFYSLAMVSLVRGDPDRLEHLHQLQNLFFALTGTELEIKF